MTTDTEQALPTDTEALQQMVRALQAQLMESEQARQSLLEQFRLAQHKQFGKSAESFPGQGELFNEAEAEVEKAVEDTPETEDIHYTRNKPKRKPLPKDLPRETIVHDLPDAEKVCDCCGGELHQMGEVRSEKLEFIPAQVKVIEHVRPKYSCRHCEQHGTEVKIKVAAVPPSPIPKGIATASLLAQVISSKYQYGLPLYRQEQWFKQHGIELSRQTMADWVIRSAELLKPLYLKLKAIQLGQPVIHADETTVRVLDQDKSKCYMWVYCTGTDSPGKSELYNIVLYDYQPGRGAQYPVDYLNGFTGYLQVDGYVSNEKTQAILVGCWAHCRRKFHEAKLAQTKGKSGKADMALSLIQKLYRVEKQVSGKSPAERLQARRQTSTRYVKQFRQWLEKSQNVLPSTKLGEAIQYALNQWPKLLRYLEDGQHANRQQSGRAGNQTVRDWTQKLAILEHHQWRQRQCDTLQSRRNGQSQWSQST